MYIKQALQTATNSDNRTYEQTQKEMQQEKQQPTDSSATQESQGGQILAGLRLPQRATRRWRPGYGARLLRCRRQYPIYGHSLIYGPCYRFMRVIAHSWTL